MCLAEGAFCSTSPRSIRTTFHVEQEPPETFATRAWWAQLSRWLKRSCLTSLIHAVDSEMWFQRLFRLHISENPLPALEFISTCYPIESFCFCILFSLELLYYCKVLYFKLGLLRVVQSVWHPLASVLSSTTCILEYACAPNGWPRNVVCVLKDGSHWIRCSFSHRLLHVNPPAPFNVVSSAVTIQIKAKRLSKL